MTSEMTNRSSGVKEYRSDLKILTVQPFEVNGLMHRDFHSVILDVRTSRDFISGHVPKAVNLPEGNWDRITDWPDQSLMIIYSYDNDCPLCKKAARTFAAYNYAVIAMEGGFAAWKESNLPVEK